MTGFHTLGWDDVGGHKLRSFGRRRKMNHNFPRYKYNAKRRFLKFKGKIIIMSEFSEKTRHIFFITGGLIAFSQGQINKGLRTSEKRKNFDIWVLLTLDRAWVTTWQTSSLIISKNSLPRKRRDPASCAKKHSHQIQWPMNDKKRVPPSDSEIRTEVSAK